MKKKNHPVTFVWFLSVASYSSLSVSKLNFVQLLTALWWFTGKDKQTRVDVTSLLVGLIAGGVALVTIGLLLWYFCQVKCKDDLNRARWVRGCFITINGSCVIPVHFMFSMWLLLYHILIEVPLRPQTWAQFVSYISPDTWTNWQHIII